jgi:hypothetical protein
MRPDIRSAQSSEAAIALRPILPAVRAPTLVFYRRDSPWARTGVRTSRASLTRAS